MKFVSTRELRNNPSDFRETLEHEDVVLTVNGKPFALAVGTREEEFEETLDLIRQVRALRAVKRMQEMAVERGLDRMTNEEIDEEIRESRAARRSET